MEKAKEDDTKQEFLYPTVGFKEQLEIIDSILLALDRLPEHELWKGLNIMDEKRYLYLFQGMLAELVRLEERLEKLASP